MPTDLRYIVLIFGLFVLPKFLQRYAIPGAVTSLALGFVASLGDFLPRDHTLGLLATFGIVSLFLAAGLEVDLDDLRPALRPLLLHLFAFVLLVWGVSHLGHLLLELSPRAATILALALLTPSGGFIFDSLAAFGLQRPEIRRVRATVIATEILSLLLLFALTQSSSLPRFGLASVTLVALVLLIPPAMKLFARHVEPHAPRTEFAFLMMLAVVCAYVTRKLGVYYLVGAFLVGLSARRFRERLPALSSDRLLQTVEEFAIVFGPFYFFQAGGELLAEDFDAWAVLFGVGLTLVLVPLRVLQVALLQPPGKGIAWPERRRVATALLPTLVFSLVLLGILRAEYGLEGRIVGAVMVYTLLATLLPGFLLRRARGARLDVAPETAPETADDAGPTPAAEQT